MKKLTTVVLASVIFSANKEIKIIHQLMSSCSYGSPVVVVVNVSVGRRGNPFNAEKNIRILVSPW